MTSTDFPGTSRGRGDTITTVKEHSIPMDAIYPRDAAHRYRIYMRDDDGLHVLAATDSAGGIGEAIVQIHADQKEHGRRLADLGTLGVLDVLPDDGPGHPHGEWIVLPWSRS